MHKYQDINSLIIIFDLRKRGIFWSLLHQTNWRLNRPFPVYLSYKSYFVRLRNARGCYCVRHSKRLELKLRGRQSTTLDGIRPWTADNDRTVELTLLFNKVGYRGASICRYPYPYFLDSKRQKEKFLAYLSSRPSLHSQQPYPQGLESGRRKGNFWEWACIHRYYSISHVSLIRTVIGAV